MAGRASFVGGGGLGFGVTFVLEDAFSDVANKIQSKFDEMDKSVSGVADRIQNSMSKIAGGVGLIISGLGLLSPLIKGMNVAAGFENYEVQLTTLLRSREAAVAALEKIKEDAKRNPVFGTEQLMQANTALISQDIDPERARGIANALAGALAAMGKGNAELSRMGVNLQGIAALGKATAQDMKQFAFAGINMYKLVSEATGKTEEELHDMPITLEMIEKGLLKATSAGGRYEGALERAAASTQGAMAEAGDNIEFMFDRIGKAIKPATDFLIHTFNQLMDRINTFMNTRLGKLITMIGAAVLVFISLGMVIAGLKILFVALAPAIWAALLPLIKFVIAMLPLLAIFAIFYYAWQRFNAVMKDGAPVRSGFMGFMQRLGGILQGVWEILSSMNDEGFSLSENMAQALEKLGILNTVIAIGTWLVRIRAFMVGIWEGLKAGFQAVWDVIKTIGKALSPIGDLLSKAVGGIGKNMTALEKWKQAGKIFGYVIVGVITIIIIALAVMAIAWVASMIVPILIIAAVIAALYLLYRVIMWLAEAWNWVKTKAGQAWDWIKNKIIGFWEWIKSLPRMMWQAGVNMVRSLMDGIKQMWSNFTSWLWDKIKSIPLLGDVIEFFSGDSAVDTEIHRVITQKIEAAPEAERAGMIAQLKKEGYAKADELEKQYSPNVNANITVPVYLDSEKINEKQVALDKLNDTRQ